MKSLKLATVALCCQDGLSTIVIDGIEFSKKVSAITFQHRAGDIPVITVTIPTDQVDIQYVGSLAVEKWPPR